MIVHRIGMEYESVGEAGRERFSDLKKRWVYDLMGVDVINRTVWFRIPGYTGLFSRYENVTSASLKRLLRFLTSRCVLPFIQKMKRPSPDDRYGVYGGKVDHFVLLASPWGVSEDGFPSYKVQALVHRRGAMLSYIRDVNASTLKRLTRMVE